jgi:DNA-binding response OmpR family regulator
VSQNPESPSATIFIIEPNEATTATYVRMLTLKGYQVQTATDSIAGLRAVASSHPDAIILDFICPA